MQGVVIFDLDGTLVDSAPDIAASVEFALNQMGRAVPSYEQIIGYVGNGAARLIHRCLSGTKDGDADAASYEVAAKLFFDNYENNICRRSHAYPGVRETLETLKSSGFGLACATNKPQRFTEPLLEALELTPYFDMVLGGDSLPRKKPAPDQLLHIAAQFGISRDRCVMIGDSATDLAAAQSAGIAAVVVDYGYGDTQEFSAYSPVAVISAFAELMNYLPKNGGDARAIA